MFAHFVEAVQEEAMAVTATYQEDQLNFDIDTFNTALAVLLAIAVMFVVMVIAGVWLFVLSCLKSSMRSTVWKTTIWRRISSM